MDKKRKCEHSALWFIILMGTYALISAFLIISEKIILQNGLELRTWAQEVKGTLLYLVIPLLILYTVFLYIIKRGKKSVFLNIALVLVTLGICVFSFMSGVSYVMSPKCKYEKMLDSGLIKADYSEFLDENHTDYYEPVTIFCRRVFSGWSKEAILKVIEKRYGRDVAFVHEDLDGSIRMEQENKDVGMVEFEVQRDAAITDNYEETLLLLYAQKFWSDKQHLYEFPQSIYDADTKKYTGEAFILNCDSREDRKECAEEIQEWIEYMKDKQDYFKSEYTGLYQVYIMIAPWNEEKSIYLKDAFSMTKKQQLKYLIESLEEDYNWERKMNKWNESYDSIDSTDEYNITEGSIGSPDNEEEDEFDPEALGDEYALSDEKIYRLVILDAAAGSRFYVLIMSKDGGKSYQEINADPFLGDMGVSAGVKFLDENTGFIALAHNGGDSAEIYYTCNGGKSFTLLCLPTAKEVDPLDGTTYEPFDFPDMPYEENGMLYVKVGQGEDGDFRGGDACIKGLYQSEDMGFSWKYIGTTEP